jgi:hypothetical protein
VKQCIVELQNENKDLKKLVSKHTDMVSDLISNLKSSKSPIKSKSSFADKQVFDKDDVSSDFDLILIKKLEEEIYFLRKEGTTKSDIIKSLTNGSLYRDETDLSYNVTKNNFCNNCYRKQKLDNSFLLHNTKSNNKDDEIEKNNLSSDNTNIRSQTGSSKDSYTNGNKLGKSKTSLNQRLKNLANYKRNPSVSDNQSENKNKINKSNNIIIFGGPMPIFYNNNENNKQDSIFVTQTLSKIGLNVNSPLKIRRYPKSGSSLNQSSPSTLLSVELKTKEDCHLAIRNSRILQSDNIFIRPERSFADQIKFNTLYKEKKRLNDILLNKNTLDQPFCFVVRGNKVRCLDHPKSTEAKKSIYTGWHRAIAATQ